MSLCVSSSVAVLTFVVGSFSFEAIKVQTKLLFFFRGLVQASYRTMPHVIPQKSADVTEK